MTNDKCVILVPAFGPISSRCDEGLRHLAERGYPIRRVPGFSAIDQGRNQMASDALHDGFEETMWIDTDIGFTADDVERLRSHGLPLVAGIYPQPRGRSLACHLLPDVKTVVLGKEGGLTEIKYAAAGFLHVRRAVYEAIRETQELPLCNTRFGRGVWPFFQSIAVEDRVTLALSASEGVAAGTPGVRGQRSGVRGQKSEVSGQKSEVRFRYLTEEYAFCHRARQVGIKIMADTSIRLWRHGSYPFGWEDAGGARERVETYHFHVEKATAGSTM